MTTTELINSARDASRVFVRLTEKADEIWVATAWASDRTDVAKALWKARKHITRLVVGLDFHQTDPAFLKRFRAYARVHQSADGTFHPKVYVFRLGSAFECLVGSSNFTKGGFGPNTEANVHVRGKTSESLFRALTERIASFFDGGHQMLERDLLDYAKAHAARRRDVRRVSEYWPPRRQVENVSLDLSWSEYVTRLLGQTTKHALFPTVRSPGYIGVTNEVQGIFRKRKRLASMTENERRKVAGLEGPYKYFGSMVGAGYFRSYVLTEPHRLDRALSHIPAAPRAVTRPQFDAFRAALPRRGMSQPAVGSRLLAMKRPDVFLCVNSQNRRKLSQAFGLSQASLNTYEGYWELLQLVWRCAWWRSPRPARRHRQVWDARVALVDAFYYDP